MTWPKCDWCGRGEGLVLFCLDEPDFLFEIDAICERCDRDEAKRQIPTLEFFESDFGQHWIVPARYASPPFTYDAAAVPGAVGLNEEKT